MADSTAYVTTLGTILVLVVGLVTLAGLGLRDLGKRVERLSVTLSTSIEEQGQYLGNRIDDMNGRIMLASMCARLDATNSRIETLGVDLSARLDDSNRRISSLESVVEARFGAVVAGSRR